jgi:hypothetical protein
LQDCLDRVHKSKRSQRPSILLHQNLPVAAGFAIFFGKIDRGVDRVNMIGKRAKAPVAA